MELQCVLLRVVDAEEFFTGQTICDIDRTTINCGVGRLNKTWRQRFLPIRVGGATDAS